MPPPPPVSTQFWKNYKIGIEEKLGGGIPETTIPPSTLRGYVSVAQLVRSARGETHPEP